MKGYSSTLSKLFRQNSLSRSTGKQMAFKPSFFLLFLFFTPFLLYSEVNGNGDFQLWNEQTVQGRLAGNIKVKAHIEWRLGDDCSKLYYQHSQMGLQIQLNKHLYINPAYRQIFTRFINREDLRNDWITSYAPFLDIFLRKKLERLRVTSRLRVMFQAFNGSLVKNRWVFREKLQLIYPWELFQANVSSFASYEFFVSTFGGVTQQRAKTGFIFPFAPNFKADFCYMARFLKDPNWQVFLTSSSWTFQNVLVAQLHFYF